MNHLNEIDDNINELIMNKSFDRLTEAEKVKALEYAGSEEEYNNLRQTLMAITSSFNEEAEEDFAEDDVKSDLMSQFEKKFGKSNDRTRVVPLYRKPYFQLAIAASLALLLFLSIPIFKDHGTNVENKSIAKVEATGNNTGAERKDEKATAPADLVTGGANKPDQGSGVTLDASLDDSEKNKTNDAETIIDERKPEQTATTALAESKEQQQKQVLREDALLKKEAARSENDLTDGVANNNARYFAKDKNDSKGRKDAADLQQETMDEKTVPAKITEVEETSTMSNKKTQNELATATGKEKEKAAEYKHHTGDHTHDHLERMNSMATSGTTGPSRNITTSVVGFVEEKKDKMMDLLFTVY